MSPPPTGSRLDGLQAYEWPKGVELLVEPMLSVLAVRRIGWGSDDYVEWSARMMR